MSRKDYTTTTNTMIGKMYAGPSLPEGACIIGTITRDVRGNPITGALIKLSSGVLVQYNAGIIRNLPGKMGNRKRVTEKMTVVGVPVRESVFMKIPKPRGKYCREAVELKMKNDGLL